MHIFILAQLQIMQKVINTMQTTESVSWNNGKNSIFIENDQIGIADLKDPKNSAVKYFNIKDTAKAIRFAKAEKCPFDVITKFVTNVIVPHLLRLSGEKIEEDKS